MTFQGSCQSLLLAIHPKHFQILFKKPLRTQVLTATQKTLKKILCQVNEMLIEFILLWALKYKFDLELLTKIQLRNRHKIDGSAYNGRLVRKKTRPADWCRNDDSCRQ